MLSVAENALSFKKRTKGHFVKQIKFVKFTL